MRSALGVGACQDILDDADQVGERFENYDPTPATNDPSRNTCSNEQLSHDHEANEGSWTR